MPTYGWIREDSVDGFLEGTEYVADPQPPPDVVFPCPFCSEHYPNMRGLQEHISDAHKVERPILLLDGAECEARMVVRKAGSFRALNTTAVRLRLDAQTEQAVSAHSIDRRISGLTQAICRVTLENVAGEKMAPVRSTYRLEFRIADPKTLRAVDDAFLSHLVEPPTTVAAVDRFLQDARCGGAGHDYAQGLAEYVIGVLIKEQPDGQTITSPVARYVERFGSAAQVLGRQPRPMANLISALIRFAMNDFTSRPSHTGFDSLDRATALLRDPFGASGDNAYAMELNPPSRRSICPIDYGTQRLLDFAARAIRQARWSASFEEECRQVAEAVSLEPTDRQKADALWAIAAVRLRQPRVAIEPLSRIAAVYPFSNWATPCLESINPK